MKNRFENVKAKLFSTQVSGFSFPEERISELDEKKNVGICFSGGGTRSASLTMGQLRGLQQIGVLDKVKYLSAVSGGSWGSVPFLFLDESITDEHFLGMYADPGDITENMLSYAPKYSLTNAISNSKLFDDLIKNIFAGDERYANIIAEIFLKPFNIGSMRKFFTYDKNSLLEILKNNPQLLPNDFYLMNSRPNRPYPVIGGTLLRPDFGRYQFEMTPLYVGIDGLWKKAGAGGYDIGGGYIEPHGFDSDSPHSYDKTSGLVEVELGRSKHMFTPGDVIGTSGAAPAEYATRLGLQWLGFPEYKYWSPANPNNTKAKETEFGDGGILENLGIMPMLKRGVKKLIIFVNCKTKLRKDDKGDVAIASSIPALFHQINNQNGEGNFDENVIFAFQEDKYDKLVDGLLNKIRLGESAIFTDTYDVTTQPHHNIKGGSKVDIMWVYNSRVDNWVNKLPIEIKHKLVNDKYGKRFPNYKTFMENFPSIIDMTPEQVNLMAHQAAWNIVSSETEIKNFI